MNITAVVVAAGMSRRMGHDNKLLLSFGGKPLFLHIVDELIASTVSEIILVRGFEEENILAHISNRKIKSYFNEDYVSGLTSSIQTGIKHSSTNADAFLICLSDMPFVKKEHIQKIMETGENENRIVIPKSNGKRTHPILFSADFKNEILQHQEPNGCKRIIHQHKSKVKFIEFEEDFNIDIDTPDDYKEYLNPKT